MNRDWVVPGGCVAFAVTSAVLFIMSSVAIRDGAGSGNALFAASISVFVVGLIVMGGIFGIMLWRDSREIEQGRLDLIGRAARLEQEREQVRARRSAEVESAVTEARPAAKAAPATMPTTRLRTTATRALRDMTECPLCQTRILKAELYVTCPACKTSHHQDCWNYNGGCAVYGCPVRIDGSA